jgi:hypothetical protein
MARGAAALTAVALVVTLIAVYIGTRRAFDPEFIYGARTVLVLLLAAVAIALVARPLRKLTRTRGIGDIERRAPDFNGRLETYDGLTHSNRSTPFLTLLAEDALNLARRIPIALKIPSRQISVPAALAVLAVGALVWFAAFGPDNWRYGVRHLWAGWLFEDTLPPQRIAVLPGDGTVRRGGDFRVEAQAEGFDPTSMEVYALFAEGGSWESAPMDRAQGDAFGFTFFAVREPLRYYVSAARVRSPEYNVEVVDVPRISNIKLTYNFPNWTKLEPRIEEPGSDIDAVEGTQVTVELVTDQPLNLPELVANGERVAMQTAGNTSTATLEVTKEGEYFVSTLVSNDSVKVTDDYLISVTPDLKPVVKVVKPGRDWRASNIEEVSVRVEASDDFGLDKLELHYSVNGGEWKTATLPVEGNQATGLETLFLEEMKQPVRPQIAFQSEEPRERNMSPFRIGPGGIEEFRVRPRRPAEAQPQPAEPAEAPAATAEPQERALEPGDVISYYAVAGDRGREVQTDLFFVEVQPFDRSFSQATAGGGGGGGGGGQQQDEISRRQKEILVATWNLIRERQEGTSSYLDEQQLHDNSQMLADLQRTLAEQARTLASRTRARQLTGVDERIQQFVQALEQAAAAMGPAAERLADIKLDDAVPPEQEALQHLLRAESVFTDIQVAFQQGGGGAGGFAGRDLSELFELEMDLEKNQYETEAPVAFDSPEQQVDEAIAKLQELARRQEALANQANRRNGLTEQERWQQESLRRETEELKRQLEQMQQQLAQAQQQQQGQQQGQQQQGQQGQGGQQSQSDQQGQGQGSQTQQAIQQLSQALENMNRAGSQGQQNMDPEQARRAIEQARRQLQQALEQLTAQRQEAVSEAYSDLAERSEQLYEEQRQVAQDLQEALRDNASNQSSRSGRGGVGLPDEQAQELADRKEDLARELEALERDMERIAQQFREQTPGASEELRDALTNLQTTQAGARLSVGADYIRSGRGAAQVAATESITTSALRDLQRSTEEALTLANQEAVGGEQLEADPNAELVAELQSLRRQLAELTQQQQPQLQELQRGQDGQPGQEGQQGQGQQAGNSQQGGAQNGGQQAGGNFRGGAFGGPRNGPYGGPGGFYDPLRGGVWDPRNFANWQNPETIEQAREQLTNASRDLLTLGNRLGAERLTDEELRALRQLGEALRGSLTGNPELIEEEFQALVNLAEQLELKLAGANDASERSAVRAEAPAQIAQGYEDAVAEYFRKLSQSQAR